MTELEQLEQDLALVKERGGRPELIQKLDAQIARLRDQNVKPDGEITHDPERQFDELFKSADAEIRSRYVEGTAEFISTHHPDLDRQISEANDKMQELWKKGRKGEARVEEFITALEERKLLHIQAIDLFKSENI